MANNHYYYNIGNTIVKDFIGKCLNIIKKQIEKRPDKRLHFNHEEYMFLSENNEGEIVPFIHQHTNNEVELYSNDGWIEPESIGNWADIAVQIVKDIEKGDASRWGYEKGFMTQEAHLVAFTRWGYVCENTIFPNKTQAVKQGRFLKRNGFAFSFKVYQKNEQGHLELIAKG